MGKTKNINKYCSIGILILLFVSLFAFNVYAAEEKIGGTLKIAYYDAISGLDPIRHGQASGGIHSVIFDRLCTINPDGSVGPALATSWEWVDEDKIRFELREGVKFHSGENFDAEVAKWNIEKIMDEDVGAIQRGYVDPIIDKVLIEDQYTILLELEYPDSEILQMAANHLIMRDPSQVKELGDKFGLNPSGTGPYMLKEWDKGERVILERNPNWWGENNYIEELQFEIIPEESVRFMAILTGDVDVAKKLSPESINRANEEQNLIVKSSPSDRTVKLDFNYDLEKWNNANLRKAINLAIDAEAITDALISPAGKPATSMISSIHESHKKIDGWLEYNPDKAIELLKNEGYELVDGTFEKDGNPLTVKIGAPPQRDLRNDQVAEFIDSMLKDIGIQSSVVVVEMSEFWPSLLRDEIPYDIFFTGWGTMLQEINQMFYGHFHGDQKSPSGLNMSRRSGDPLDSLIEEARTTIDSEERIKKLKELQKIFFEGSVAIPIYEVNNMTVITDKVKGYEEHTLSAFNYRYCGVWLE